MFFADEPLLLRMAKESQQPVVVAADVQQTGRLVVDAKLIPGQCLEQLVKGSESARQGDVGVGQLGKTAFALVH